jgi:hypothetical protein
MIEETCGTITNDILQYQKCICRFAKITNYFDKYFQVSRTNLSIYLLYKKLALYLHVVLPLRRLAPIIRVIVGMAASLHVIIG